MSKNELGNKSHKIRRAFIISTICAGVLALGVGAMAGLAAKPILLAINGCLLAGAVGVSVGTGVAINKIYDTAAIKINKKKATKALEEIKQIEKDTSSKYSQAQRAKVLRKYAKANLVLTRKLGATIFGEYHTTSGMKNKKGTELLNTIDALYILKDTATTDSARNKYAKKLQLAQSKLAKITAEEGIRTSKCKWTKSYENVLTGATALDRRTEIACLTSSARDAFKSLMENNEEVTDNKCINVTMSFNEASSIAPCIARAEDQTKMTAIKSILLQDAAIACQGKTPLEVRSMFPITIESKLIKKDSTKLVKRDVITVNSYSELVELNTPTKAK